MSVSLTDSIVGFRLGPSQRRLWRQGAPGQAPLSRARAVIKTPITVAWTAKQLEDLGRRNENLRMRLQQLPGMDAPLQVIEEAIAPMIVEQDLRSHVPIGREEKMAEAWAKRPAFNWREGPLLHVDLLRIGKNEQVVQLTTPSILADAESLVLALAELANVADGGRLGSASDIQYLHYSEWLHDTADTDEGRLGREAWQESLRTTPCFRLPYESPLRSSAKAETVTEVPAVDAETALAAWTAVLGRYGDTSDVLVSCRCAGRPFDELQFAVGPMAVFLPTRLRWKGENTVAAFRDDVDGERRNATERLAHYDPEMRAGGQADVVAHVIAFAGVV